MNEAEFNKRLYALAKLCREDLPDFVLDLYDRVFERLGYGLGCRAVELHILKRRASDRFPSVQDLKDLVTPKEPLEIDQANECAGKIFEAITKHGWNASEKASEYMGDIAWRVVQQFGGWVTICEQITSKNATTYRAQFRDAALAAIRLAKAGQLGAPTFAQVTSGNSAKMPEHKVSELVSSTAGRLGISNQSPANGGTDGKDN